ncbi:MAG: hypothetical protein IPJ62_10720 [Betaproteobacteria bacterium]|nr:hypothetical protein [Betaproteobacteria bacterium]
MRPNFALGPIDSIAQYLLYVSIVVLGVVLPLLVQKWRQRRERSLLLARTIRTLRDELGANRERLLVSRGSFEVLGNALHGDYEHYLRLWHGLRDAADPPLEPLPPPAEDRLITLASLSRTAWEVAQLSNALPTIAPDQLRELTRAYVLQTVFEEAGACCSNTRFARKRWTRRSTCGTSGRSSRGWGCWRSIARSCATRRRC